MNDDLEPDDNGACLCLSGKKYKDCCKDKVAFSRSQKGVLNANDGLDELFLVKESKLPSRRFADKIIRNGMIYNDEGDVRISNDVLTALVVLIAESRPAEKELIIGLVMNIIVGV